MQYGTGTRSASVAGAGGLKRSERSAGRGHQTRQGDRDRGARKLRAARGMQVDTSHWGVPPVIGAQGNSTAIGGA